MTDREKIKAEIKRRRSLIFPWDYEEDGEVARELDSLIEFIDSMPVRRRTHK